MLFPFWFCFVIFTFVSCFNIVVGKLNALHLYIHNFLALFSSQVLAQLNVFADEDIDAAAEALNDVNLVFPYLCSLFYLNLNLNFLRLIYGVARQVFFEQKNYRRKNTYNFVRHCS